MPNDVWNNVTMAWSEDGDVDPTLNTLYARDLAVKVISRSQGHLHHHWNCRRPWQLVCYHYLHLLYQDR